MNTVSTSHTNSTPTLILYDYGRCAKDIVDYRNEKTELFRSNAHWLHPVFELEQYLLYAESRAHVDRANYVVYDKILGLGSAYLFLHLRLSVVLTTVGSIAGISLLKANDVCCLFDNKIDALECHTEELLALKRNISVSEAYKLLCIQHRKSTTPEG